MGKKRMSIMIGLLLCCAAFIFADEIVVSPIENLSEDFIRGADISILGEIEKNGGKYYDENGVEKDLFAILKESGVNWIRLRLWHNPVNEADVMVGDKVISKKGDPVGGGNNDLKRTVELAKRAKAAGFKFLLDIHYSDFWADPGKQNKPAAWKNMNAEELEVAVYEYTADVMKAMNEAGCSPDMVQTGNELNGGMLWPEGKTWANGDEKIGGMKTFAKFLKAAGKAVRENDLTGKVKIAIHLADGGDNGLYRHVFDGLTKEKVDFDAIGLSYYNYWHGSLAALEANMADLKKRYGKEMFIAETAYAYTEEDFDSQGNVFMVYSDETSGYMPSVQGQATVVRDIMNSVHKVGGELGLGVFYWEPAWIPVKNVGWRTGEGSNWDNQAMFDKKGKALPSLKVFKKVYDKTDVKIEAKSFEKIELTIAPNEKEKQLPEFAKIIYSDDSVKAGKIIWDAHDFSKETEIRTFPVDGTLEGTSFKVVANVTVSNKVNLVADSSFETGKLDDWTLNGPAAASFLENNKSNAYSGNWTYKYWLGSGFKSLLSRTFKDIPNGTYTLSIWAMGGGGENDVKLYARNFGTDKTISVKIVNTGWKEWKQYIIPDVPVTNGQCTIGIYLDTNPDCWGNFDNIEFYKN